jgi:dihydroorotate dehydrogenase
VFRGIDLVRDIKSSLSATLDKSPGTGLADLVGADAATMTAEKWPA